MDNEKLKTLPALLKVLRSLKKQGRRIVFTNGCFDILHKGHVQYLQEAKKLGDALVVGLNSDASVSKLKGPGRPVNAELDRAYVLGALACVDYITIFAEDTPYEILSEIKPDILVKGGDYKEGEVVGREFAGETKIITFVAGYSTSSTIAKMKNS